MTTVKDRILLFIENQGFNKENFFEIVGLSYSNFKGIQKKSGLNSDAIVKILSFYPQINLYWLVLGKGEMLVQEKEVKYPVDENQLDVVNEPTDEILLELVKTLKENVSDLKKEVEELKDDKELLKNVIKTKLGKANAS